MTEAEWLVCDDPLLLLNFLEGQAGRRKRRLLTCAFSRLTWDVLPSSWQHAVEVAERLADGQATDADRSAAFAAASQGNRVPAWAVAAAYACYRDASLGNTLGAARAVLLRNSEDGVRLAELVRDTFTPFRTFTLDPTWQTLVVTSITQAAYDERILPTATLDPDRLAVLADALEDAGCDDRDILDHLRSPGPHVRGCWAVDLLLDKK